MQKGWTKWTKEMDAFLIENFDWIGDYRLAEMFEGRFPKGYPWTSKHIEKRRYYLQLKRTADQEFTLRFLQCLCVDREQSWNTRGRMKEGEVRSWNGRKYIKHNSKVLLYGRHVTEAKKGQIARLIDGDYKIITKADHARMNKQKSMELPEDVRQTVKALNQLKKLIYGKENPRPTRNTF